MARWSVVVVALLLSLDAAGAQVREVQYDGFKVWVDCARRGPILFFYVAHRDSGNNPRASSYKRDPDFPPECQSRTTREFGRNRRGVLYDVGHQVPANHFDGSTRAILQTNYWTNLLPQTMSINRGAWRESEDIIECVRDQVVLDVWGGAIWDNATNDFVASHGIQTPSAFWKVVIRNDDRKAIAWIVPNKTRMGRPMLDRTLTSVAEIEQLTGRSFNVSNRSEKLTKSWPRPRGCRIG